MKVRVFAPAKINLTLQVGAPRADAMHPLQSAVMFADVGDWIEVAAAPAASLQIEGPFAAELASASDNIVLRASDALARYAKVERSAAITLEKNLPVAAGIGGGSSDAAATLKALRQLWGLNASDGELAEIGVSLGADIPVCVHGRAAWMTGVGEHVAPLHTQALHAVLVNPRRALATADVFRAFDAAGLGGGFAPSPAPEWRTAKAAVAGARAIGNDLAAPARTLMPAIAEIEAALRGDARVIYSSLSGSGATCFGLVESRSDAEQVAAELSRQRNDWWVRATTLGGALDQAQAQG